MGFPVRPSLLYSNGLMSLLFTNGRTCTKVPEHDSYHGGD